MSQQFTKGLSDYSQCGINLKQIGLALEQYRDTYRYFPPAFVADANGRPLHSWRVLILPYLGQDDLYAAYDMNEPWDGPNNRKLVNRMPPAFRCPSIPAANASDTNYLAVVGPETVLGPGTPVSIGAIEDGFLNTLMVVESTVAVNWMEPRDLDFSRMSFVLNDPANDSISTSHLDRAQVLYADGSARSLPGETTPAVVRALCTRAGGESLPTH